MSPFYRLGATVSEVWAKSDRETDAWMPLVQHCADTAEVARIYWNDHMAPSSRHVVERCLSESSNSGVAEGLAHRIAIFLAASHDIGKASPAFAVQVPALADRMRQVGFTFPTTVTIYTSRTGSSASSISAQQQGRRRSRSFWVATTGFTPPRAKAIYAAGSPALTRSG